ncbi:hypothetical protein ACFY40_00380 [Streptomyces sp. NPDC012950]|uniref:hypothetical protein n=1 Tax=Streptomyces sp. NPDC012950 TaxID=3364858 RepID=UPI00367CE7F1
MKSVPIVYATGMNAACTTSSYGMPRKRANSLFRGRFPVVHTVPRPRSRAAGVKLRAAGRIEPRVPAWWVTEAPSVRPSTQGMT